MFENSTSEIEEMPKTSYWELIWCFSNGGDEVSMCHFKEIYSWLENRCVCIRGPKMVPKLYKNAAQMVPNAPPTPIPIAGVSKSLLPGGKNKKENNIC